MSLSKSEQTNAQTDAQTDAQTWPHHKRVRESWDLRTVFQWEALSVLDANRMKVLRQEVETALKNTQKDLSMDYYYVLKLAVEAAKKERVDVADIEEQMPELRKKCLRQEVEAALKRVEAALKNTQKDLSMDYYYVLELAVEAAKKERVDVADIEEQMPELRKKCLRQEVETALKSTQKDISMLSYDFLQYAVTAPKEAGVKVPYAELQMSKPFQQHLRADINDLLWKIHRNPERDCIAELRRAVEVAKEAKTYDSYVEPHILELFKKCLRANVDIWLWRIKNNPTMRYYKELKSAVYDAKEREVDLSDVEEQMPELRKECLRGDVDSGLLQTQDDPRMDHYNALQSAVTAAKEAGVDVADIEEQMPELRKECLRGDVVFRIWQTQYDPRMDYYNALKNAVKAAKAEGVYVTDAEEQMPELRKKCLRGDVDSGLQETKGDFRSLEYEKLQSAVTAAKEAGVDVADIEEQMPELRKKCFRGDVDFWLQVTTKYPRGSDYEKLLSDVKAAKEAGVDVADIEEQMPELRKECLRADVNFLLKETKKYRRSVDYEKLQSAVIAAKEAGVDVADIEEQMPELEKKCKSTENGTHG